MHIDLKKIRERAGITQSEMANRLGLKLRTIQKYEKLKEVPPSIKKLIEHEFRYLNEKFNPKDISKEIDNIAYKIETDEMIGISVCLSPEQILIIKLKEKVSYLNGQVDLLSSQLDKVKTKQPSQSPKTK